MVVVFDAICVSVVLLLLSIFLFSGEFITAGVKSDSHHSDTPSATASPDSLHHVTLESLEVAYLEKSLRMSRLALAHLNLAVVGDLTGMCLLGNGGDAGSCLHSC